MEALQLRATQEAAPGTVQLGANGVFEIDPIDVSCLEVKKMHLVNMPSNVFCEDATFDLTKQ